MVGKLLLPEIKSLIDARDFGALRELFREWPPADVAEVILDMEEDDRVIIFRVLPSALAADVFEYLDVDAQQELLRAMAHEQVVGDPERNVAGRSHGVAGRIAKRSRAATHPVAYARRTPGRQSLLGYPEDSVGRLMTPDFIAVQRGLDREGGARLRPRDTGRTAKRSM